MFNLAKQLKFDKDFRITSTTMSLNNFFFYLRKIPLIGKHIPTKIFNLQNFKSFLGIFLLVFNYISLFVKKILFELIFIIWMNFTHSGDPINSIQIGLIAWAILSCFINPISTALSINGASNKLYDFSTWFHQDPKLAIYNQLILNDFVSSIVYLPVLLITSLIIRNPIFGLNLAIIYFLMQLVSISLNLFFLRKININKKKKNYPIYFFNILTLILYIASLAFIQFFPNLDIFTPLFSSLITTVIGTALTLISYFIFVHSLKNFPTEKVMAVYQFDQDSLADLDSLDSSNDYITSGKEYADKLKLNSSNQNISTNYTDNNFLNYLLFKRYNAILKKKLRNRLIIICTIGLGIVALISYMTFIQQDPLTHQDLLKLLPSVFFFMYILALGKDIVSLCFVNCDQAMLYYPFYREPKAIIRGFFYRFKISLIYNLIISTVIFINIALVQFAIDNTSPIQNYLLIFGTCISLGFLFSFHYLFVYYMLQPFTIDGSVKNPIFKTIDYLFYFISYFQMRLSDNFSIKPYPLIIISLAIIYVGFGTFAIYRYAPKTFKIRK